MRRSCRSRWRRSATFLNSSRRFRRRHDMTSIRRRVLRPQPVAPASDQLRATIDRQRVRLEKERTVDEPHATSLGGRREASAADRSPREGFGSPAGLAVAGWKQFSNLHSRRRTSPMPSWKSPPCATPGSRRGWRRCPCSTTPAQPHRTPASNAASRPPRSGATTGIQLYDQSLSRLPGTGSRACARRGARSRAGLIA